MQSSMADDVPNSSAHSPGSMASSSEAEVCQTHPRASEKSAFSQTCILLNKYLKENGSLGDLRIGVSQALQGTAGPAEKSDRVTGMTMDLFPTTHNPVDDSLVFRKRLDSPREMDLFSPHKPDSIDAHSGSPALKPAQLTIFYAGKVMVFDNVTTQKAAELIQLAGQVCVNPNRPLAPKEAKASVADSLPPNPPAPIPTGIMKEFARDDTSLNRKPQPVIMHDLPIARKASLQRFLAKRKDRIAGRGPYAVSGMSLSCDGGGAEGKPWLGMGIV